MKISTKGRYGLRVMLDLAVYGNEKYGSYYKCGQKSGF